MTELELEHRSTKPLRSEGNRRLHIPLIHKKMNKVEQNVKAYSHTEKSQVSDARRLRDSLSSSTRMIYGGKVDPDSKYKQPNDHRCYIRYSPLKQFEMKQKINQLSTIGAQYQRLKIGLLKRQPNSNRSPLPLIEKDKRVETSENKSLEDIVGDLRNEKIREDGKQYFADLYLLKRERDFLTLSAKKGISPDRYGSKCEEEKKLIIDRKSKENLEKKSKMIRNKGLNWNVYYESLALSKSEKKKLNNKQLKFVSCFGTD